MSHQPLSLPVVPVIFESELVNSEKKEKKNKRKKEKGKRKIKNEKNVFTLFKNGYFSKRYIAVEKMCTGK